MYLVDVKMDHSLINISAIRNYNLGIMISVTGRISSQSSGVIAALSQQAGLLEPDSSKHPVVILENDFR
jgi:hypothetical protein